MTRQRGLILEELRKSSSHPTADEVYMMVRDRLPTISLGTVYRNLEILSEMGYILKLESCGTQRRYDGDRKNHYHIRCLHCGKVDDLPENVGMNISYDPQKIPDYTVCGHTIILNGICTECNRVKEWKSKRFYCLFSAFLSERSGHSQVLTAA